jgi:hypothetical protein
MSHGCSDIKWVGPLVSEHLVTSRLTHQALPAAMPALSSRTVRFVFPCGHYCAPNWNTR